MKLNVVVVPDPVHSWLAFQIIRKGNLQVVPLEYKKFPDGESYIRIQESVDGKEVIYVSTGYPNQNNSIIRAILIIETLKDLGAKKVLAFFAYFPYARQDKRFLPGEAISAKIIAKSLVSAGADEILTIDVHAEHIYKGLPVKNITTEELWASFLKKIEEDNPLIIAPDKGRRAFLKKVADKAGLEHNLVTFEKKRDLKTGKIIGHEPIEKDLWEKLIKEAKSAVLIDDIISTGGTAASIINQLRKEFKGKIIAAFTHGLFLPGSIEKLIRAGTDEIISTNTVKNPFAKIDVTELVLKRLKKQT